VLHKAAVVIGALCETLIIACYTYLLNNLFCHFEQHVLFSTVGIGRNMRKTALNGQGYFMRVNLDCD
jgi:hypothetical protein